MKRVKWSRRVTLCRTYTSRKHRRMGVRREGGASMPQRYARRDGRSKRYTMDPVTASHAPMRTTMTTRQSVCADGYSCTPASDDPWRHRENAYNAVLVRPRRCLLMPEGDRERYTRSITMLSRVSPSRSSAQTCRHTCGNASITEYRVKRVSESQPQACCNERHGRPEGDACSAEWNGP